MLNIIAITAPLFLLIGLGYGAVRQRLMPMEAIPHLGRFVLYCAMPALIFTTLAGTDIDAVLVPPFIAAYALGTLLMIGLGLLLTRRLLGQEPLLAALKTLGMAVPNTPYFGYPVLLQVLAGAATPAFAMALLVETLLIIPLMLTLLEFHSARAQGKPLGQALYRLPGRILRNPLLIAIAAGITASLIELRLPAPLQASLEMLSRTSAALALFVIGGSLVGSRLQGQWRGLGMVLAGKLVLHPLLVALMVWWLPPFDSRLQQGVILLAAMPMMSIYPIFGLQYGHRAFASNALLLTTAAAFVSLSVILLLLSA